VLKQNTAKLRQRMAALAARPVILFAALGLFSGALSVPLSYLQGTELWRLPLVGLAFGVAVCLALHLAVRPKWLLLAIAFLAIQIAWQAAIYTAFQPIVALAPMGEPSFGQNAHGPNAGPVPTRAEGRDSWGRHMILPVLTAGAIGAVGTWLGAAFCAAKLRSPSAAFGVTLTGALAGLALGVDWYMGVDWYALFPIWQMAVAAALGFLIGADRP
jgi:hypothetical protein